MLPDVVASNKHVALVVMPPISRHSNSHLVVCPRYEAVLRVYDLPSRSLVLVHKLADSAEVTSLAADPSGCALVVADQDAKAIYTLAWPLPLAGM